MFYFVPSWYRQERPWYQETPSWFAIFEQMSFDDTINQLKIFQTAKEEANLLVLNYQPQLRYFLHQQDLLATPYWSFFDDIQNCRLKYTKAIDFKSLDWPQGTVFTYSSFIVVARQGGQVIGEIYFGENGNLLSIQRFHNGLKTNCYIFDDRGFISSILYFKDDIPVFQDYLNVHGVWQIREELVDQKRLIINPEADRFYQSPIYPDWESLISERLEVFKTSFVSHKDILIVASHPQHNRLLSQVFLDQQKVYSFFGQRFDFSSSSDIQELASSSALLVTSDTTLENELQMVFTDMGLTLPKMTRISPFDTRLRLGRSQTVKELNVCFFIDSLNEENYLKVIHELLDIMVSHPLMHLTLLTYRRDFPVEQLKNKVVDMVNNHYHRQHFMSAVASKSENQLDDDMAEELSVVSVEFLSNDSQLMTLLDTARLVLDLGEKPDLYTQIASLSAGIPQINMVQSEYVTHGENGLVLTALSDLSGALDYYFDGLTNWNKSLVHTVQKMGDYTSGRLVTQLKELLEE